VPRPSFRFPNQELHRYLPTNARGTLLPPYPPESKRIQAKKLEHNSFQDFLVRKSFQSCNKLGVPTLTRKNLIIFLINLIWIIHPHTWHTLPKLHKQLPLLFYLKVNFPLISPMCSYFRS
jgi:hypothetical protein